MRELALSRDYLDELDDARRLIDALHADHWPVPRLVWRARHVYREAWRREVQRYRNAGRE